ncbi:MAG: class I SAM-dependent methyltransferase [Clostridiales bacterium]|jgi:tRNA (adenine22-N1)-methyltransferase|nr:class I SAM-dependent methyltransferase [Clostridiales bacterium]
MDVSKRISFIADLVDCKVMADIGTDHGYLPITAINRKNAEYIIATDINKKPLNKARENIMEAGLSDRIQLRLGSGLSPVSINEADCAVISGMGGLLIKEILEKDIDKARSFKEIIISPQSDIEAVRRFCHRAGFMIKAEHLIYDMDKFYNIMALGLGEDVFYDDKAYRYGRLLYENSNGVYLDFAKSEVKRIIYVINEIKRGAKTYGSLRKLDALNEDLQFYKEFCQ